MKWMYPIGLILLAFIAFVYFSDFNFQAKEQKNPLLQSIYTHDVQQLDEILSEQADQGPMLHNEAILNYAIQYGDVEIFERLLQSSYRAELFQEEEITGLTPYELAVRLHEYEMQLAILRFATEADIPLNSRETLHRAVEKIAYKQFNEMLNAGFDVNEVDENGNSVAIAIAQQLSILDNQVNAYYLKIMMQRVLAAKVDLSIANNNGITFIQYIIEQDQSDNISPLTVYIKELKELLYKYDYVEQFNELNENL